MTTAPEQKTADSHDGKNHVEVSRTGFTIQLNGATLFVVATIFFGTAASVAALAIALTR